MEIYTEIKIEVPVQRVWQLLTNFADFFPSSPALKLHALDSSGEILWTTCALDFIGNYFLARLDRAKK